MWVALYHVFHCNGTVRLVPDRVATPLPAAILLLRVVTADVTCSSVACAIIVTLISCLLCRNLVTVPYMLQYYFWDVMSCIPMDVHWFFGRNCSLNFQGQKVSSNWNCGKAPAFCWLSTHMRAADVKGKYGCK
jgi:hypothetical protein